MANSAFVKIAGSILLSVLFIAFIIPGTSAFVRRLHDINLSGKWLILFYGIAIVTFGYGEYILFSLMKHYPSGDFSNVSDAEGGQFLIFGFLMLVNLVINLAYLVLMLLRGSSGDNKYGAPHDYINRDHAVSLSK